MCADLVPPHRYRCVPKYHIGGTSSHIGNLILQQWVVTTEYDVMRGGTHRYRCVQKGKKKAPTWGYRCGTFHSAVCGLVLCRIRHLASSWHNPRLPLDVWVQTVPIRLKNILPRCVRRHPCRETLVTIVRLSGESLSRYTNPIAFAYPIQDPAMASLIKPDAWFFSRSITARRSWLSAVLWVAVVRLRRASTKRLPCLALKRSILHTVGWWTIAVVRLDQGTHFNTMPLVHIHCQWLSDGPRDSRCQTWTGTCSLFDSWC